VFPGAVDVHPIDDPDSELWAGGGSSDARVWPALTESLSEPGRRLLYEALRDAVDATPGDPERALMVVEAFRRTHRARPVEFASAAEEP
jgi:hypothetical protein